MVMVVAASEIGCCRWLGCTCLLSPLLPRYMAEGKHYLTIAIGCTGGKHRSVHVAQKLGGFLESSGYKVTVRHRDVAAK